MWLRRGTICSRSSAHTHTGTARRCVAVPPFGGLEFREKHLATAPHNRRGARYGVATPTRIDVVATCWASARVFLLSLAIHGPSSLPRAGVKTLAADERDYLAIQNKHTPNLLTKIKVHYIYKSKRFAHLFCVNIYNTRILSHRDARIPSLSIEEHGGRCVARFAAADALTHQRDTRIALHLKIAACRGPCKFELPIIKHFSWLIIAPLISTLLARAAI